LKRGDKQYKEYGLNDTVGAGIIYCINNTYKFFFTLNGKLFSDMFEITTLNKLIPMINFNYNAPVKVNFNKSRFKYDFRRHILPIVISTNISS
jgi:hypothetical protein